MLLADVSVLRSTAFAESLLSRESDMRGVKDSKEAPEQREDFRTPRSFVYSAGKSTHVPTSRLSHLHLLVHSHALVIKKPPARSSQER